MTEDRKTALPGLIVGGLVALVAVAFSATWLWANVLSDLFKPAQSTMDVSIATASNMPAVAQIIVNGTLVGTYPAVRGGGDAVPFSGETGGLTTRPAEQDAHAIRLFWSELPGDRAFDVELSIKDDALGGGTAPNARDLRVVVGPNGYYEILSLPPQNLEDATAGVKALLEGGEAPFTAADFRNVAQGCAAQNPVLLEDGQLLRKAVDQFGAQALAATSPTVAPSARVRACPAGVSQ